MQHGKNGKNFNNSCYIYRSACNFFALPPPAALFFSHSLPPPSSNCPARTDISIAQKTCVFRPVDISVAAKRSKLIYQSVYSLLGIPLPSAHCVRSHLPQGQRPRPLSQALSGLPALPKGEPLAVRQSSRLNRKVCRRASSPLGELSRSD